MKQLMKSGFTTLTMMALSGAAPAQTSLIANDPGPNRGVRSAAVQHLSDQIAERSGGSLSVKNNWGGALFKTTAALESLGTGWPILAW